MSIDVELVTRKPNRPFAVRIARASGLRNRPVQRHALCSNRRSGTNHMTATIT